MTEQEQRRRALELAAIGEGFLRMLREDGYTPGEVVGVLGAMVASVFTMIEDHGQRSHAFAGWTQRLRESMLN